MWLTTVGVQLPSPRVSLADICVGFAAVAIAGAIEVGET